MRHLLLLLPLALGVASPAAAQPADDRIAVVTLAELVGPGVISTGGFELAPAFHPGGETLYFVKSAPAFLRDADFTVLVSRSREGRWQRPEVAPFSGRWSDINPWVSPDGRRLYFASNRPVAGDAPADFNLWVLEWAEGGWGEPKVLPWPINTEANELWLTATDDGVLYFDSDRAGDEGGWEIYRVEPRGADHGPAEPVVAVNSDGLDINPLVARDGSWLLFSSWDRSGTGTRGDLYLSRAGEAGWSEPRALDLVNSPADESHPALSPDGRYLYFTSDRGFRLKRPDRALRYEELEERLSGPGNGLGDIYRILVQHLDVDLS